MTRDNIIDDYFEWLCSLVCNHRSSNRVLFSKLLSRLHDIEFRYILPMDRNRAENGKSLRWRYSYTHDLDDIPECLDGPCSVLEMMICLAIHCEESIMDDPYIGDRTGQWFWGMVVNLGLGGMVNDRFDSDYVNDVIDRFLNRDYDPDGRGGLFTVKDAPRDLRDVEIWHQLCWYLDSIT